MKNNPHFVKTFSDVMILGSVSRKGLKSEGQLGAVKRIVDLSMESLGGNETIMAASIFVFTQITNIAWQTENMLLIHDDVDVTHLKRGWRFHLKGIFFRN